ncbi:hypothetical protein INS49_015276 [Diaporthe citri]|uniref:uncharacterized protein n=1 Tax=Diaporthe citri TaxID=83186 RepID=UPI001C7EFBA4|nr:uncharacterized protein INS49_015276 [Diaporthe citri]KAG6355892.1 hypothetical protein INS49_015276 [Diaporthe citri]
MSTLNCLNNTNLHEGPFASTEYNKLPHIDDMKDAAASHPKEHAILLGIIAAHGLSEQFSIHLVHKHFNIADGRVMVYETVQGNSHGGFAAPGGTMVAYEFTTEPGMDLSDHESFINKFATAVLELGVEDIFALTALSICPRGQCPHRDVQLATSTDWLVTSDYAQYAGGSVPGMIQLKCSVTRSGSHYNVTCSRTRNGSHLGHAPDPFSGDPPQDQVLTINGEALEEGTEPHAIVPRLGGD